MGAGGTHSTGWLEARPLQLSTESGEKFPGRDRIRWDTRLTQADRQRECEMPPKRYGIRSWWEAMTSSRPGISNVCNFKRFLDLPLMEPLHGINSHADVRRDLLSACQWRGVDISAFLAINKWERERETRSSSLHFSLSDSCPAFWWFRVNQQSCENVEVILYLLSPSINQTSISLAKSKSFILETT